MANTTNTSACKYLARLRSGKASASLGATRIVLSKSETAQRLLEHGRVSTKDGLPPAKVAPLHREAQKSPGYTRADRSPTVIQRTEGFRCFTEHEAPRTTIPTEQRVRLPVHLWCCCSSARVTSRVRSRLGYLPPRTKKCDSEALEGASKQRGLRRCRVVAITARRIGNHVPRLKGLGTDFVKQLKLRSKIWIVERRRFGVRSYLYGGGCFIAERSDLRGAGGAPRPHRAHPRIWLRHFRQASQRA